MRPLDEMAPNFRRAVARWPGAASLASHYEDLASTFEGSQNSVIELTKSFLESVCTTILRDEGIRTDPNAKTTQLLKVASTAVGLVHTRGASRFDKVLSSYFRLTDDINDLRNNEGTVAHGKDGFLDALCENHLRILVLTADAVVALLLGSLDGVEPNLLHSRRPFGTFEHFNRRIDAATSCVAEVIEPEAGGDANGGIGQVVVLEFTTPELQDGVSLVLRPSELLFSHDRDAYIEILNTAPALLAEEGEADAEGEVPPAPAVGVSNAEGSGP